MQLIGSVLVFLGGTGLGALVFLCLRVVSWARVQQQQALFWTSFAERAEARWAQTLALIDRHHRERVDHADAQASVVLDHVRLVAAALASEIHEAAVAHRQDHRLSTAPEPMGSPTPAPPSTTAPESTTRGPAPVQTHARRPANANTKPAAPRLRGPLPPPVPPPPPAPRVPVSDRSTPVSPLPVASSTPLGEGDATPPSGWSAEQIRAHARAPEGKAPL